MPSASNIVVTYDNAAALVIAYLKPLITPLAVAHDVPNPRPTNFVRILRTGGPREGVLDLVQLTIESWAYAADTAESNAQIVRRHINNMVGASLSSHPVYKVVELSGPAELPDPLSDSHRVTWNIQAWIRGI